MNENNSNGLQTIITQVIEEMKSEQGDKFDINRINLAEMERRTGMTRAQLRRLKKNDFQITPHALTGRKADTTIISGYTGVIDDLLKKGVSNSEVIAYSAESAHPFRRNGAPFRFKLSSAQIVN